MYERFTDRARRAIKTAEEKARAFNYDSLRTEHILLGILSYDCVACNALKTLGCEREFLKGVVERRLVRGLTPTVPIPCLPIEPSTERVLLHSFGKARQWGNYCVSTEHILLGLLMEKEGVGPLVLYNVGVTLENAEAAVCAISPRNDVPSLLPERIQEPLDQLVLQLGIEPHEYERALTEAMRIIKHSSVKA
ncbi:MAG TPA: Clp protease N-terminal domain-containing protein [Candidatus Andersenbacteria bacterium]|nr:Clp protease N-terminal domain-containing protein [Candidatus Andersenbacteria bacterium]